MNIFEALINGKYRRHNQNQREHNKHILSIEKQLSEFDEAGLRFEEWIDVFAAETEAKLKKNEHSQ
ncbi:hypothetical protein P9738_13265 [Bacillus siamensis]|uniref:hypothetical protein n=1 Tax=Bacillus siamensis TaxID=659243 RepID=UPI0022B7CEE1|nr:hypothetical protein [Bacillus siamensis]MDU0813291.1 hypothetical protein [Bacillus siamensis]MED5047582.1 hypothetical protein [Bacillus siamensis]MED5097167.1 hypothetical protein [Bacillus siamensis]